MRERCETKESCCSAMNYVIDVDPLTGADIHSLLQEHLDDMHAVSPIESAHALDIASLRGSDITFWRIAHGSTLVGCGALKQLSEDHGEIKSMRTVTAYRGQGVAQAMLNHIVQIAVTRHYAHLSLETGSMDAFRPARRLYENAGFQYCEPFADYREDPNSVFMTLFLLNQR